MNSQELKMNILDTCSDDAYGSWELWWGVKPKDADNIDFLKNAFVDCIDELIKEKKLNALHHRSWDGKENIYSPAEFGRSRLAYEVEHSLQETGLDPDTFYWFEATDEGRKEYKEWATSH